MINTRSSTSTKRRGLGELPHVELNPHHQMMLAAAVHLCGGDPPTRNRLQAEARELLQLAQIAPPGRLRVRWIDLTQGLRALLSMSVPVACHPHGGHELPVADNALLGFTYPHQAIREPVPGHAFFQILEPRGVWLPQVMQPVQSLCIAAEVPAGTRSAMLILRAYGALSMQSIQVDASDPAGVFQPEIAAWWQQNLDRVPLTNTAFLEPDNT